MVGKYLKIRVKERQSSSAVRFYEYEGLVTKTTENYVHMIHKGEKVIFKFDDIKKIENLRS